MFSKSIRILTIILLNSFLASGANAQGSHTNCELSNEWYSNDVLPESSACSDAKGYAKAAITAVENKDGDQKFWAKQEVSKDCRIAYSGNQSSWKECVQCGYKDLDVAYTPKENKKSFTYILGHSKVKQVY